MSIFGSIRDRPLVIQLPSEDVERRSRRRPLHVVIPGESDPIIAQHIAEMIEFLTPFDDLIPELYQEYVPTIYGNDDEDRLISTLQRVWILRCIIVGEYEELPSTEMRSCLRRHFGEQALLDGHALAQSSLLSLVDYFNRLSQEAKRDLNTKNELEMVSKHQRVLWGHRFEIPDGLTLDLRRQRCTKENSPNMEPPDESSSPPYIRTSGFMDESGLAFAPGSAGRPPSHPFPIRGRVDLPTPPPRAYFSGQSNVAAPLPASAPSGQIVDNTSARSQPGFTVYSFGQELFDRVLLFASNPQLYRPNQRPGDRTRRSASSRLDPR